MITCVFLLCAAAISLISLYINLSSPFPWPTSWKYTEVVTHFVFVPETQILTVSELIVWLDVCRLQHRVTAIWHVEKKMNCGYLEIKKKDLICSSSWLAWGKGREVDLWMWRGQEKINQWYHLHGNLANHQPQQFSQPMREPDCCHTHLHAAPHTHSHTHADTLSAHQTCSSSAADDMWPKEQLCCVGGWFFTWKEIYARMYSCCFPSSYGQYCTPCWGGGTIISQSHDILFMFCLPHNISRTVCFHTIGLRKQGEKGACLTCLSFDHQ